MSTTSVAVIDVGTNSTNLLVLDANGTQLVRTVATTRLGDGLHKTGQLSPDGIERTVDTIAMHVETAKEHAVTNVLVVGTAACRRANNTNELIEAVQSRTGITLTVLSESDEASLTFAGALTDLPELLAPTLVIDIGGGSTEYTVGVIAPDQSASIPFGAVTSTESHISSDLPKPEDLTNLIGAVADELEELSRLIPALASPARVIGVAGTIVTVAAIELGLHTFDDQLLHGMILTREAAEDVFRTMATEPLSLRRQNPGLPADRADIIVAGCCILVATMRRLRIDEIIVSTRSLLDGVANRARLSP